MMNLKENKIRSFAKLWIHKHPRIYAIYKQGVFRFYTPSIRTLPDFLIIGAVKCGTTSLYDYLIQHPEIYSALRKEAKFFDNDYDLGQNFYKTNFPTIFEKFFKEKLTKNFFLTGEATPNYLFHPQVPQRVFQTNSKIKLIIILRNPIDRAYSDYQMHVRDGLEKLSFENVIEYEKKILTKNEQITWNDSHYIYNSKFFPYLARGIYFEQIARWMKVFPKKQFLILNIKDLNSNPTSLTNKVFQFLNLNNFETKNLTRSNVGSYQKMKDHTRKDLLEFFRPHNEKLEKLLDLKLNWNE